MPSAVDSAKACRCANWKHAVARAICVVVLAVATAAQAPAGRDPILILVSFDGWRWDYIDRAGVPNLKALAARGVRARELIPSFPSFTFPNHYTIVTGLYPEHHGIVHNTIDDPSYPERFTTSSATAREARWWGGEPMWVTAERQGRRAMSMFWPGSEAPIRGVRPTDWVPFDDEVSNQDRVAQVLKWLALPADRRGSFFTVYFSEVDHAGHDFGPESMEVMTAASHLDAALGHLVDGVRRLALDDRTTFVIVSDHGMASLHDRFIFLDDYVDMNSIDFVDMGPFLQLRPKPAMLDTMYRQLRGHRHLSIYKREQTPARFHYRNNPRIAPIIGVADEGWIVTTHRRESGRKPDDRPRRGAHGYDPRLRSMHGLFAAAGPTIRGGIVVAPFQNIHIYDFMCAVLGLTPAPNDGDPRVTRSFLVR